MTSLPWPMVWTQWLFVGGVIAAFAAAGWAAVRHPRPRPDLPVEHVAAAALIGLVAWDSLVDVPELVAITSGPYTLTAATVFVVGTVIAIVGILRRRTWGAVLGIGLAATQVLGGAAALIQLATFEAEAVGETIYLEFIAPTIVMDSIPLLVAIGLLLWPLRRRSSATDGGGPEPADSRTWQPTPADPPR